MVDPLPRGTRIADRFEIESVLGRGGFSIVYEASDLRRRDRAVLKEFVPPDSTRTGELLDLGPHAATLRHTFLTEAQVVSKLNLPGIVPVRLAFVANGTAYVATDAVRGAKTLDALLRETGPLDVDGVLDLAYQLLETLEGVHRKGLLHRDVKPSNVLVGPDGRAYLLDFGAARAWTADALEAHTVLFTPGFAPPEQRSTLARRGPTTDVYGLCATLYAALSKRAPVDAAARAGGEALVRLAELRPDLDPGIAEAIESGLALRASDRPATMAGLRSLFDEGPGRGALDTLESLDALLSRAQRFAYDRRACPACPGVLEEARPLRRNVCPVCRRGQIRARKLNPRACPLCRAGALRIRGDEQVCDACAGRLVLQADGRMRNSANGQAWYPAEWARIGAALDPTAGDGFCDACDAEYALDAERLTLLRAPEDLHGFAAAYLGRSLPRERIRWLAVGKRTPQPGLVCDRCDTEFDHVGRLLKLVGSPNRRIDRLAGETRTLESWHRLAEGLPEAGREAEIEARIVQALSTAFRRGEVGFGDLAWRGPVIYLHRRMTLTVGSESLRLGKGLRVKHVRLADLSNLRVEGNRILADGPDGPFELEIEPVELVAHLASGERAVRLSAADLAARLAWTGCLRERFRVGQVHSDPPR